jgi:DNA-binding transcriptional LysR family regulator
MKIETRDHGERRRELRFARRLDWNLLKMFYEICQAGGLTGAARQLSRKQPAISLALRRLEANLNVVLCRRGPTGFELTDEGHALAKVCHQIVELVRGVPDSFNKPSAEVTGHVRVRLVSNLIAVALDEAIQSFHSKFPAVEIVIEIGAWSEIVNALLQHKIDVGIAPARTKRAELRYHQLFAEVHRPYCGRLHPLFGKAGLTPYDLREEPFVLTGADEGDELTAYRLRYGLGQNVAGMSDHLEEAKRLVKLGVGLCFLPEQLAEPEVEAGKLWPLLTDNEVPRTSIYVVTDPALSHHAARDLFIRELIAASPEA